MNSKQQGNIVKKKILGIGHPRTGTGYTSKLLNSWGLRVSHEEMLDDGMICWQFTNHNNQDLPYYLLKDKSLRRENYSFDTIIYNVRNPLYSLPSIIYTEKSSLEYRSKFVNIDTTQNILSQAIDSLIGWDGLVKNNHVHVIYRIEDQHKFLFDNLKQKYDNIVWDKSWVNKTYNERYHLSFDSILKLIKDVDKNKLDQVNAYCVKYGYNPIFDTKKFTLNTIKLI